MSDLILGLHLDNSSKYSRPCSKCGVMIMLVRRVGPGSRQWISVDCKPEDEAGVRYYRYHVCGPRPVEVKPGPGDFRAGND